MRGQRFYVLTSTELVSIPLATASLTCGGLVGLQGALPAIYALPLIALGSMWLGALFAVIRSETRHTYLDDETPEG